MQLRLQVALINVARVQKGTSWAAAHIEEETQDQGVVERGGAIHWEVVAWEWHGVSSWRNSTVQTARPARHPDGPESAEHRP